MGGLPKAILPMAGVKPGGKQEMLSIPFQQTARYVKYYGNDVSTEEEKVIRKVLDYDTIERIMIQIFLTQ